jgi:putative nucleotidyltransferase-like protein
VRQDLHQALPAKRQLRLRPPLPAREDWTARLRACRASLVRWLVSGEVPPPDGELASVAVGQGLAARLSRAVEGAATWPIHLREVLRDGARVGLVRSLTQLEVAERVVSLLRAQNLRSLPLKGCAVAEWLYDSPAERPMNDVDVLCLDDWPGARRVLEGNGFLAREEADHAASLYDPGTGVIVELHRSVTSCPGLFPADAEGLWNRSQERRRQRRPAPEDLLIQLALHATFQHGLVLTLGQYLDFRHLLERSPLDPDRVFAAARAARAERLLAPALGLAENLVGATVPPAVGEWTEAQLSARQRRWLRDVVGDPLRFIAPAPAPLAAVRWMVLQGRRVELVQRTLWRHEGAGRSGGSAAGNAIRRAWTVARRAAGERHRPAALRTR